MDRLHLPAKAALSVPEGAFSQPTRCSVSTGKPTLPSKVLTSHFASTGAACPRNLLAAAGEGAILAGAVVLLCHKKQICLIMFSWLRKYPRQPHKENRWGHF